LWERAHACGAMGLPGRNMTGGNGHRQSAGTPGYSTRAPRVLVGTAGGTGLCLVERRALRLRAQPLAHAPQPVWHDARQSTQRCSRATPSMQQCNMQRPELQHATWNGATGQQAQRNISSATPDACMPTDPHCRHLPFERPQRRTPPAASAVGPVSACGPLHRCIRCSVASRRHLSASALSSRTDWIRSSTSRTAFASLPYLRAASAPCTLKPQARKP
jgi:hypothetical protein